MKPENFPGRKWARQMAALDKLPAATKHERPLLTHERNALMAAAALGNQRDVRTKKDRSDRARFAR